MSQEEFTIPTPEQHLLEGEKGRLPASLGNAALSAVASGLKEIPANSVEAEEPSKIDVIYKSSKEGYIPVALLPKRQPVVAEPSLEHSA